MTRLRFSSVAALALSLAWACATTTPASSDDDDGSGAGGMAQGGAGPNQASCDEYIDCVAAATPGGLADVIAAYGDTGSCWQQLSQEQCLKACFDGLAMLGQGFPNIPECGGIETTTTTGSGGGSCAGCAPYLDAVRNRTPFDMQTMCGYDSNSYDVNPLSSYGLARALERCYCLPYKGGCNAVCVEQCSGEGADIEPACSDCVETAKTAACSTEYDACAMDVAGTSG